MGYKLVQIPGLPEPLKFDDRIPDGAINAMIQRDWGEHIAKHKEFSRLMGRPGEMESLMLGAGDTVKGLELGTRELLGQDVSADQQIRADVQQYVGEDPNLFNVGKALPYFAIPTGAGSKPAEMALRAAKLGGIGSAVGKSAVADAAIQGGLLGAADIDMTAAEGAGFGAGGAALTKLGLGLLKPSDKAVRGDRAVAAQKGANLGYQLTPAQVSDSKILRMIERSLESNPLTAGGVLKVSEANQANSNRIVAEALGFRGRHAVTPKMLDDVAERFSKRFKDATDNRPIKLDDEFVDVLADIEAHNVDYWVHNKDMQDVINRALDTAAEHGGIVKGKDYQILSSKLTKAIRANYKPGGNPEFGEQLMRLKDGLDDAMERALGPSARAEFAAVRADYKTYANLMKHSVINEDTGDVSLRQLGNILRREDRYGYRRGHDTSDLYEATRFTRAFPDAFGNSGTAQRGSIPAIAGLSGAGAIAGYNADEEGSAAGAAAGLLGVPAAMWMLGRGYASPAGREYLTKGIWPGMTSKITPYSRQFLAQKMGLLGVAAGSQ